MNLPNRITVFRLVVIPFLIAMLICGNYYNEPNFLITSGNWQLSYFDLIAGILFLIGATSDFLDGYFARKKNQVTTFGKFFDPIADKLLVNSTLILFTWRAIIPVWVTLLLIARDIWVDFIRIMLANKQVTLAADLWGKLKTVLQMIGLTLLFFLSYQRFNGVLGAEYGWYNQLILIPIYFATFFSLFSGALYFKKAYPTIFSKGVEEV